MSTSTADPGAAGAPTGESASSTRLTTSRGDLWWAVPGAVVGALAFWAAHRGLIDDAYITLDYVRNVARDLHWGLIPTEESNAATSPLNVLMLSLSTWLLSFVTGDVRPVLGLGLLTVVLSAAMAVWAARTARHLGVSTAWALAVLAVVFANPFVNSALGLEVLPISAFVMGLTAQAVRGRQVAFGVLAGLLVLTRLDLGVIVAVVYLLTPALRRRRWVAPAVAAAVSLPWYAFSWWHFGSAIPATFVIKTLQESFGDQTFFNGPWTLWAGRGGLPFALAAAPAAIGLVTVLTLLTGGLRRRLAGHLWPVAAIGLGGVAYYVAYSLLGVPPYQWYYVPSTVALGVAGVLGLALALRQVTPISPRGVRWAGPAVTAALLAALAVTSLDGRPLPWQYPVYFGAWALPSEYRDIGAAVHDEIGDGTVLAPPEIGTLAFGCDCSMVDVFSDPGTTLPLIEQRIDQAGPVGRFLLELNFARLDRDREPRDPDHRLVWTQGEVPEGVPSWPTHSPATGPATLYLEPVG
ncbi:hypothetical protein [Modestobacter roseus]|uniref:hypothetical protein n=1 Tax=Modestobacter roseus TaxID=1181884 RepID=UPI0034DF8FC5